MFYHLVTGEVVYSSSDVLQSELVNALTTTTDGKINVVKLGEAQQALQMSLHQVYGEDFTKNAKIKNVVLMSICTLGEFTNEEFHAGKPNSK